MSRDFVLYRKNYKCGAIMEGNKIYVIDYIPPLKLIRKYDFVYAEYNNVIYHPDHYDCVSFGAPLDRDLTFSIYHIKNNKVADFAIYEFHVININPPRRSLKLLENIRKMAEKNKKIQKEAILSYLSDSDEEDEDAPNVFKYMYLTHFNTENAAIQE